MPMCIHMRFSPEAGILLVFLSRDFRFRIRLLVLGVRVSGGYPDLDRVFATVVNQGNGRFGPMDAVDGHAHFALVFATLPDMDVVDGFPIAVVDLEPLPIRRQARRKSQPIHVKAEPQE
jgi:hypothetical protein